MVTEGGEDRWVVGPWRVGPLEGIAMAEGDAEVLPPDLPSRVFDGLFDQIVGGGRAPGDLLPSERSLADEYGVNRQVVREALKRLDQLGLIAADRGNGTRVLDWRVTGSFDILPILVARALGDSSLEPLLIARHLLDLRLGFTLTVAQLCVLRASDDDLEHLLAVARRVGELTDVAERLVAEWDVWALTAKVTGNVAMELLLNSMRSAAGPSMLLMFRASTNILGHPDEIVAAFEAMVRRDAAATDAAVRHLYRIDATPELLAAEERATQHQ